MGLSLCCEVRYCGLDQLFRLGIKGGRGSGRLAVSQDQGPNDLPPAPILPYPNTQGPRNTT